MLARGNQIQSKPQSVVRCARGNGELIPATTVYKPLLLSCFIGLQFIYSWITLFFVFCFFLLVGFHVHEILDFRVETARSRKSVLRFDILQTVSFVSIFFFFGFKHTLITHLYKTHSLAVLEVRIMSRLHTVKPDQIIFLSFSPKTVAAAPEFQVQTNTFQWHLAIMRSPLKWNMRVTTSDPQWYKSYHLIICLQRSNKIILNTYDQRKAGGRKDEE